MSPGWRVLAIGVENAGRPGAARAPGRPARRCRWACPRVTGAGSPPCRIHMPVILRIASPSRCGPSLIGTCWLDVAHGGRSRWAAGRTRAAGQEVGALRRWAGRGPHRQSRGHRRATVRVSRPGTDAWADDGFGRSFAAARDVGVGRQRPRRLKSRQRRELSRPDEAADADQPTAPSVGTASGRNRTLPDALSVGGFSE